ncbi:beta-glucosidase family 9 [Chitinophaga costaii]|uniref:Beta-glucosidase family 9 n=1 Tax=Chitinophaga costaii TaxID=1335309 RepID=A0A1C4AKV8_9BACT|nr:glycoside hydrolase family 9 protein [Chitinophaga costaii]PUZ26646.1 glycoside hydrolase [Chitinophaga costaii]SCB95191.1 beta-glucosidase family 9 [Chitinophaga costaii]
MKYLLTFGLAIGFSASLFAQNFKVVTNHVGYETLGDKKAVIVATAPIYGVNNFQVVDENNQTVFTGTPIPQGQVKKWKNWLFWTLDFSPLTKKGTYRIEVKADKTSQFSYPFQVDDDVLERYTLSDVVYYFKSQRCSGLLDQADRHLSFERKPGNIDAHGGWYDATGDYGKHLSHLSFSNYFNPQQISLTAYSLFKTLEQLEKRPGNSFRQYKRRVFDEAMYGADYLVRMQVKDGSFYRSVGAPGPGKLAKDRVIQAEGKGFIIKTSENQTLHGEPSAQEDVKAYQVGYRAGGGLSIAALAMAARVDSGGEFNRSEYLAAAERAFKFLEANNAAVLYDGKENILDDYCALTAATELYKTTHLKTYREAADKRAFSLCSRLVSGYGETDYWRADDGTRPFFHPSDAGLPVVSLLYYLDITDTNTRNKILAVIKRSLQHELNITGAVSNPFGYGRQLVQDTAGKRYPSFFFPHNAETTPWWQGENARLGSLATAARLAANYFANDTSFRHHLRTYATDQLNWILGLNPFDASMLQGTGHNNPAYGFFNTFEYTNAPGGIINGITAGLDDTDDIDLNLSYAQTGKDYDWRWAEQWLPHTAWYLLAVSVGE